MKIFPQLDDNLTVAFSTKKLAFKELLSKLKISEENIVAAFQEHGDHIAWVGKKDLGTKIDHTDGLIAAEKDVFVAIRVADCVAVLFFYIKAKVVAAAHCGWRGTKAELAAKVVKNLDSKGVFPKDLKVFLTPSARDCCYEVSEDLAANFVEQFGEDVVTKRQGKKFLNLQLCLKLQLEKVGVEEENIFDSGICTIHNSDDFHSFRSDHSKGHNVAIIGYRS